MVWKFSSAAAQGFAGRDGKENVMQRKQAFRPKRAKPDRLGLHGRPRKLQVEGQQVGRQVEGQQVEGQQVGGQAEGQQVGGQAEGQQVGGQAEGQQVGGQEKNGQQYRLSSPIVWSVHKHYSTQGSQAITQPNTS
ncbi:TPA: hypothetical protein ACH3X3_012742 [Trebouxia sp. C0006]